MEYYDNCTALYGGSGGGGAADFILPHPPPSSSWASTLPHHHHPGMLGHQNSLHFPYQAAGTWDDDDRPAADHHLRIISDSPLGRFPNYMNNILRTSTTGDDILDAKALAASKNHSEAERRRRHRINTHLSNLRSLLPNTTKTDKASLLAEVIQHVKDLKRQTSHLIADDETLLIIPTEDDDLTVEADSVDEEGNFVIKATLCCQDRHDLLPDLIATLNSLRLRTLKAEITTLAGRVKHVLFFTSADRDYYSSSSNNNSDDDDNQDNRDDQCYYQQPRIQQQYSLSSIHEALKSVMEKGGGGNGNSSSGGSVKRQRTNRNNNI